LLAYLLLDNNSKIDDNRGENFQRSSDLNPIIEKPRSKLVQDVVIYDKQYLLNYKTNKKVRGQRPKNWQKIKE
jgi:hypothetical protein